MNENNSEIVECHSDESDFEIEITNGFFRNTVNIDIIPKMNTIEFRQNPLCNHVTETDKYEAVVNGEHKANDETDIATRRRISEEKSKPDMLDKSEENGSEEVFGEINGSDFIGWTNENDEVKETAELDDIEIEIVDGECPGTISINIIRVHSGLSDQIKDDRSNYNEQEESHGDYRIHKYINTELNTYRKTYAGESKVSGSYIPNENISNSDEAISDASSKTKIIMLNKYDLDKRRTSQSDHCLPDSDKVKYTSTKTDKVSKVFQTEGQYDNNIHKMFENLYDASELTTAQNDNETVTDTNIEQDSLDQKTTVSSKNELNQAFLVKGDHMKRSKDTNNVLLAKGQSDAGKGDFFYKRKGNEKKEEVNGCILDDVDEVIPRVIPKAGKQVTFGDEISGNRLIQLSPEKRLTSDITSPNKAEKSILKNNIPSKTRCIEAQIYYNSNYFEDDNGDDSGLSGDDDHNRWEYRNDAYQPPRRLDTFSEAYVSPYKQLSEQQNHQIRDQRYFCSSDRYTRHYRTTRSYVDFQATNVSILKRSKEKTNTENDATPYAKHSSEVKQTTLIRPPGNYTNSPQKEVSIKNNHSPLPSFIASGFNNSGRNSNSKNTVSNKQTRRDKKKKHYKKRGKHANVETDIERFQRFLSTAQVRLTSKGNIDVRRLKLEYLLHIGDFSLKYKTESGVLEPMTVTIYTDVVGPSLDVRHMLNMQSNFINRLRYVLRRGNEIWLLHKFLPIGALQVLMNRDPYRAVLGEVHAQFITAGLLIGVNYLHQNGITHGNLYPWKILINNRGYPVLTGFLPLHDVDDPVTSELRERRSCTFSVPYAAPDRFIADMDPSVDIFSIGCIAYEIAIGRTPFYGRSEEGTKDNILSYSYRPIFEYDIFSFAGEMFIDSCLRKYSAHRFVPGRHLSNLYHEEWFSTLDLGRYEDQTLESPILHVLQLLHEGVTLDVDERNLDYDWGQVMDIVSPHAPTLVC